MNKRERKSRKNKECVLFLVFRVRERVMEGELAERVGPSLSAVKI
jgi:hypothetical protein